MTTQKKALIAAVIVIWTILLLQIAAEVWFLYWVLPWFDVLMHFLGGLWLGLMVFVLFARHTEYVTRHFLITLFVIMGGALLIGFLWEMMEFFIDLALGTHTFQPDLPDTMSDLAMDLLGSFVAFLGIRYFLKHNHDIK